MHNYVFRVAIIITMTNNSKLGTKIKYVIGIDEVGRGPVAGPVTVCACAMPFSLYKKSYVGLAKLLKQNVFYAKGLKDPKRPKKSLTLQDIRDSKKLSPGKRQLLAEMFKTMPELRFSLASYSAAQIDKKGIAHVIRQAVADNLNQICNELLIKPEEILVLLDGSLKAPDIYMYQRTIIKGDDIEKVISCASIHAKVWRDTFMQKLDEKMIKKNAYSYGFADHKGYGTKAHMAYIRKYGLSEHHRKSFLKGY